MRFFDADLEVLAEEELHKYVPKKYLTFWTVSALVRPALRLKGVSLVGQTASSLLATSQAGAKKAPQAAALRLFFWNVYT